MSFDAKLDACICNFIQHIAFTAFEWKDRKREHTELKNNHPLTILGRTRE